MPIRKKDISRLIEQAIQYFGITDSPFEAGYLLPDGQMLDFSGKRDGELNYYRADNNRYYLKPGYPDHLKNTRGMDHRKITLAFDAECDAILKLSSKNNPINAMYPFVAFTGAIRLIVFDDVILIQMLKKPTELQIKKLKWMIFPDMSITLEFSNPKNGGTLDYFQAEKASPLQIDRFLEGLKFKREK